MSVNAGNLRILIASELAAFNDQRIIRHVHAHLVEPAPELRDWDWGEPGQQHPCWIVFRHPPSNTGIAYCENGFGPSRPWGLLWIGGQGNPLSIGQDSGWYTTFMETYFNSFAVSELPIWRVFRKDEGGQRMSMSDEGTWDETWARVMNLRERNPESYYDCACDAGIRYLGR